MSGLAIRRFVLQNISAVAAHGPSATVSAAAVGVMTGITPATTTSSSSSADATSAVSSMSDRVTRFVRRLLTGAADGGSSKSSFGLVTEEEMNWIQQRRREDAEESRIVLATRPSRSILRGTVGAALNAGLAFVVSPLVFLAVTLERIRLSTNPASLVTGPCYGFLWGGIFFACAQYAAVQQLVLCGYYSCVAAPLYFCVNRRPSDKKAQARAWVFGVLSCRYEAPRGELHARHPMLLLYDEPSVLRERAMKRLSHRNRRRNKRDAKYKPKRKNGASEESDVDTADYYALLGVQSSATPREIKEAFNRKALHLHPDRNPSPTAARDFQDVTKAYRVLSSPEKRKKFDLAGIDGAEDTGAKKRDGVRALFGGLELNKLSGDVFLGSFSQRVIDGLDFTAEELAVVRQCMYEGCRDELLSNYLAHYDATKAAEKLTTNHAVSRGAGNRAGPWRNDAVGQQLRKVLNTALAKDVLYAIGQEYRRVIAYFDLEQTAATPSAVQEGAVSGETQKVSSTSLLVLALRRAQLYMSSVAPHRVHLTRQKIRFLAKVRSQTFKNPEAMVDLAWYTSVQELELTARTVAMEVLYDPKLDVAEVRRRRAALAALADTFVAYGQPYKGASKSTMDQLMSSLREYQQQRQREEDSK